MSDSNHLNAAIVCNSQFLRESVAESLVAQGVAVPFAAPSLDTMPVDCDADVVVVVESMPGDVVASEETVEPAAKRFERWLVIGPGGTGSTLHKLCGYGRSVSAIPFEIGKDDIPHAVHLAARTKTLCVDRAFCKLPNEDMERLQRADLNEDQWEVLALLATGASNKHIAKHLEHDESRVKCIIRRLLVAIDACNRTDAAVMAARAGL